MKARHTPLGPFIIPKLSPEDVERIRASTPSIPKPSRAQDKED